MEERVIKLTLEKAKEFYKKGGDFKDLALSVFTEEELKEIYLPKTWEEFCELHNTQFPYEYFIDTHSDIVKVLDGYEREPSLDKNVLPSKEAAEAHLALMQLHQLRDCYRQGWKPNWSDGNEYKYCIINVCNVPEVRDRSTDGSFLSFQDMETANQFLDNFRYLIIKSGDLI